MHLAKLRMVGGSVMFAIPKAILESMDLMPNREVGLSVAEGRLIVDPHPQPRYTLAELVGQCDADAPLTAEDANWLEAEPIGREVL